MHNGTPHDTHSPAAHHATQLSVPIAKEVLVPVASSEETSFIGNEEAASSEQRRRGIIETV